jgi:maleamate amidohydrolase
MKLKRVALAAGCLMLGLGGCERATIGEPIPTYDRPQVALLVIDLQKDFLERRGRLPVAEAQVTPLLSATNRLVEKAGPLGVEVVYVENHFRRGDVLGNWLRHGAAVEDDAGAAPDPRVRRVDGHRFAKAQGDAFSNPDLDAYLRSRSIDHLVLAGVFADACIRLTAEGAMNRGYKVNVVSDAVAAATDGRRDRALEALRREGAELTDSEQLLAEWVRREKYLKSR